MLILLQRSALREVPPGQVASTLLHSFLLILFFFSLFFFLILFLLSIFQDGVILTLLASKLRGRNF